MLKPEFYYLSIKIIVFLTFQTQKQLIINR